MELEWFFGLFTVSNLAWFVAGVAATLAWQWVRAHMKNRMLVIRWAWMAAPLAAMVMLYIAVSTQQSANCIREFQTALTQRSAITTENDTVSQQRARVMYRWLRGIASPPPHIAALPANDPRRVDYRDQITNSSVEQLSRLWAEQERLDRQRAEHPLPEPKCGI